MLTTHRIREHFELCEMERLREEVKDLQSRLTRLQSELSQSRRPPGTTTDSPAARETSEDA